MTKNTVDGIFLNCELATIQTNGHAKVFAPSEQYIYLLKVDFFKQNSLNLSKQQTRLGCVIYSNEWTQNQLFLIE